MSTARVVTLRESDYTYAFEVHEHARKLAKHATEMLCVDVINADGTVAQTYYSDACFRDDNLALRMLENLIRSLDWTYQYTDDSEVWQREHEKWERAELWMSALRHRGLGTEVDAMYDKYKN